MIRVTLAIRVLVCHLLGVLAGAPLALMFTEPALMDLAPGIFVTTWLIAFMLSWPLFAVALLLALSVPGRIRGNPLRWSILAAAIVLALWLPGMAMVEYGSGAWHKYALAGIICTVISAVVFYVSMRPWRGTQAAGS